jgi:hypothetical protein
MMQNLPEDFAWKSSGSFPQSSEVQEKKSSCICPSIPSGGMESLSDDAGKPFR